MTTSWIASTPCCDMTGRTRIRLTCRTTDWWRTLAKNERARSLRRDEAVALEYDFKSHSKMKTLSVLVALTTDDNDYQVEQASAAEEEARRNGATLKILYADNDAIR